MKHVRPWTRRLSALVITTTAILALGANPAHAIPFHGITLQKTCVDPVKIGDPYECAYQITNADDNSESITVSSVKDQVHAASGNVDSGELIGTLTWTPSAGASCTPPGPTTTCTLPTKGATITSNLNSFYTVQALDFTLPDHVLNDDVAIVWSEPVCVNGGCPVGPKTSSTGASATVEQFTPSVETLLSPQGSVSIGTPVQDQATIFNASADAGGTVHYAVYSNNTCTTLVQDLGTKTVTNGTVGPSDVWMPLAAGSFWFQATYSGDASNAGPVSSACTSEPITVNPNTPAVNTIVVPSGPIAIGGSAHDTAQITGATATAGGTITYALFANDNCTGLIEDLTPAVNTVVNGAAPDSKSHVFTGAGTFYFQATYSGDANNTGPVSSGCAAEPLVVSPNSPTVTTLLSNPGPVPPGTLITDQATLVGATADAGGTVSYAVYSNNTCTALVQALGTKTVNNGAVGPSDAWTAATGNFWFQATYSGDANNTGPVSSVCTSEPITVEQPNVSIVKKTNGADANDPNGADVPNIAVGAAVTWTYEVTNIGTTHVPQAAVVVTDNQTGVTPVFDHEQTGNGDNIFDPGEVWIFKATGTAINLASPPAGVITSPNKCTHGGTETARTAYINLGTATIPGATDDDPSSYCNPPVPGITIVKTTNGADANDPNGADVPEITPGATVTWLYTVTNTGQSIVPKANVVVTDNQTGVTPVFDHEQTGNGDNFFDPGEVWIFTATGTAIDLSAPPAGVITSPDKCTHGGTETARTAYINLGTATIPGATSNDPSAYCNPPVPGITIVKTTNGADANDPNGADVPEITPGATVTWLYTVTNTGQTHVPQANVVVTDNQTGVTPVFDHEQTGNGDAIFDPGEVWIFKATGTAIDLSAPPAGVITSPDKCTHGGTETARTAYINLGTATIPGTTASDPSSYCNPPPPPPVVGACHETVNPAGQPNKHTDNGFPDDPFGGHAVPGGKSTSPGVNGNGPINSDGFYLVSGNLFSDTTVIDFPGAGTAWPENTTVKYTQRPGNPNITITAMAGPNSVIQYQIQAPGDLYAGAPQGAPGAIFCGVPPPPF